MADRLEKCRQKAACLQSNFDASINITQTTENLFAEGHSIWICVSDLDTFDPSGKTEHVSSDTKSRVNSEQHFWVLQGHYWKGTQPEGLFQNKSEQLNTFTKGPFKAVS